MIEFLLICKRIIREYIIFCLVDIQGLMQEGSKADIAGFGMINVTTKANSDILQKAELKVIIQYLLLTLLKGCNERGIFYNNNLKNISHLKEHNIKFIRKLNDIISK